MSLASEAIVNLLENQFSGTWQSKVDLIHFGYSDKVTDEILHHLPMNLSIKVIDGAAERPVKIMKLPEAKNAFAYSRDSEDVKFLPWNNVLRKSSVLLFGSAQQFKSHIVDITWLGNRWFRYNHIVYAPNLTTNDVIETTKSGFEIDAVAFLMNETTESIELVSSYMFTANKCRDIQLKTINRYNARISKWATNDFFPPKYRNFFNCTLTFVKIAGDQADSLNRVLMMANVPASNFVPSQLNLPYEKHNASTTDLIRSLTNIHGSLRSTEIYATATMVTNLVLYMPIGEPISLLERMFMMFDIDVWIAIGCTLLFWFISIQIINQMPKKIRDLVYGNSVKTPTMNLLDIFLNGGQHKVPANKLAKYLLMLFIIWSLIIRTCYQSKLFELLQSDLRRPYHHSLRDILTHRTSFTAIPGLRENTKSIDEVKELIDMVAEYSNRKYAWATDPVLHGVESFYRSGKNSLQIHEENVITYPVTPTFFEFSPFFQEFNDRIGRILAGGFYGKGRLNNAETKQKAEDIGPQVLTFEQLQHGFLICLIVFLSSIVVFMIEIAVHVLPIQIVRMSIYFAVKAYEQRTIIGPEKWQTTYEPQEVRKVKGTEILTLVDADEDKSEKL